MVRGLKYIMVLALSCLLAGFWWGCSDNTIKTVVSADDLAAGDAASYYLPLTEGFSAVYDLTYGDGSTDMVSLRVGKEIQMGSIVVHEWIADGPNGKDTGFVRATSDAVYYYDSPGAPSEKILELPLTVGNNWLRFEDDEDAGDDYVDILTGHNSEDTSATGDEVAKVIPTEGGNVMTVVGEEALELSNGSYFSNAVKIYNDGSVSGKKNYYWYVANIGLVKYVLGTTDRSFPRGDVTGELIDYGR